MFADLTTVNAEIPGQNEVLLASKCSSNDIWQKQQQVVSVDEIFWATFCLYLSFSAKTFKLSKNWALPFCWHDIIFHCDIKYDQQGQKGEMERWKLLEA